MKHRLSHEVQGKLFKIIHQDAAAIWATQSLPSTQMKFALNTPSDILLHNANLSCGGTKRQHASSVVRDKLFATLKEQQSGIKSVQVQQRT